MPRTTLNMDRNTISSFFNRKETPSATQKAHLLSGFIVKFLSAIVFASFLPFIFFRYVPFFKPVGVFVLGKLWDVLHFVILTTAVSIGIINSRRNEIRGNENKVEYRRISGLGAAIFGEMEQDDDEEESDLQDVQKSTVSSVGQQQKDFPADEPKKQDAPIAGVLQAKKLVTSVMSSVSHIASFGSVIEKLASNASRSFQQKPESCTKQQPDASHLTDAKVSIGCASQKDSLGTKSHKESSSMEQVEPEKSTPKANQGKNARKNVSFSFDYGKKSGESNGQEGKDGYFGLPLKGAYEQNVKLSSSSSSSSSSMTTATRATATATTKADSTERRSSISRTINVIRPSEMHKMGDEVETADGWSSNEVNVKAEAFIAKFHEQMRRQRVELVEREKKKRLERA